MSVGEPPPGREFTAKSVGVGLLTPSGQTGSRKGELYAQVSIRLSGEGLKRVWNRGTHLYPGNDAGWDMDIPLKETDVLGLEVWGSRSEKVVAVFRLVRER